MPIRSLLALAACVLAGGCLSDDQARRVLRKDEPRAQAAMLARIAREGRASLTGDLIRLLEAEDQGVRFMAAAALHKLTDIDRGFHFARGEKRQAVLTEWHQWYEAETGHPVPDWQPESLPEEDGGEAEAQPPEQRQGEAPDEEVEEALKEDQAGKEKGDSVQAPQSEGGPEAHGSAEAADTREPGPKTYRLPEIQRPEPGPSPGETKETAG